MSRITNQIANLNTVDDDDHAADKQNDAELQLFSNTTFFDLDIGRSTDIATTVDELLMQQEKQIQYPVKQQPLEDEGGPVAGPSYSQPGQSHAFGPQPTSPQFQFQQQQRQLPFDFSTLQGFSLAGELPQASLSIYDVDPLFHEQPHPEPHNGAQHVGYQHVSAHHGQEDDDPQHDDQTSHHLSHSGPSGVNELLHQHQVNRQKPVQRHELADHYAASALGNEHSSQINSPQINGHHINGRQLNGQINGHQINSHQINGTINGAINNSNQIHGNSIGDVDGSAIGKGNIPIDDEKRRRNTAASARFRVKKKQREQEMEKNQKLMQRRLADQEDRIKQLEMENTWLKSLVVEKNTARDTTSLGKLRSELLNNQ